MSASPFHSRDEHAPIADVNVVPLADVSLVLLIILLVLSPLAAQSMLKVQAAAAKAEAAPPVPAQLILQREPERLLAVGVSAQGFLIDGQLLATPAELRAWLTEALRRREERKVFVSPELEVTHGRVVEALEAVRAAGGSAALVQVVDSSVP